MVTISVTDSDGNQIEITLEKVKGKNEVKLTKKKWKKGKDPKKDKPDEEESNDLTNVKAKKDGTKITCAGPWGSTITFTINCPKPPEKPTITIFIDKPWPAKDQTLIYELTAEQKKEILDFTKTSEFPDLAMGPNKKQIVAMAAGIAAAIAITITIYLSLISIEK